MNSFSSDEDFETTIHDNKSKSRWKALKNEIGSVLASFERAEDWADLIRDLQRLGKLLQKFQDVQFLPHKSELSRRLAQCLSKSLPSGVHLKALETYDIILSRYKSCLNLRDLHLFGLGLFPLYPISSTTTRPLLMQLFEQHFIPQPVPYICNILQGFLAAVLPGIDDESSELYPRVIKLIDTIRERVSDDTFFFQTFWRTVTEFEPCRLHALNYLQICHYFMSRDDHVLVQRAVLDLLCTNIPLRTVELVFGDDAISVVKQVLKCLSRRDLSITKRDESLPLNTVERHANDDTDHLEIVTAALKQFLQANVDDIADNRSLVEPFVIIQSLFERSYLQQLFSDEIAFDILCYGYSCLKRLESHLRLSEYKRSIDDELSNESKVKSIKESSAGDVPKAFTSISHDVERRLVELLSGSCYWPVLFKMEEYLSKEERLDSSLLSAFSYALEIPVAGSKKVSALCIRLMRYCLSYMTMWSPLNRETVGEEAIHVFQFFSRLLYRYMSMKESDSGQDTELVASFREIADKFVKMAQDWLNSESLQTETSLVQPLEELVLPQIDSVLKMLCYSLSTQEMYIRILKLAQKQSLSTCYHVACSGVALFVDIYSLRSNVWESGRSDRQDSSWKEPNFDEWIVPVLRHWWNFLHPSLETCRVQSAQLWFSLQKHFPRLTQREICQSFTCPTVSERLKNLECFASLWKLVLSHQLSSTPFPVCTSSAIDLLYDNDASIRFCATNWLVDCFCMQPSCILDVLIDSVISGRIIWDTNRQSLCIELIDVTVVMHALKQLDKILSMLYDHRYILLEKNPYLFSHLQPSGSVLDRISTIFIRGEPSLKEEVKKEPLHGERRSRDRQRIELESQEASFPGALYPPSDYTHIITLLPLLFLQTEWQTSFEYLWKEHMSWNEVDLLPYIDDSSLINFHQIEDWLGSLTATCDCWKFFSDLSYTAANVLWHIFQLIQSLPELGRELTLAIYPWVLNSLLKAIERKDEALQVLLLELLERLMVYQGFTWGNMDTLHFQQVHAGVSLQNMLTLEDGGSQSIERHALFQTCYLKGIRQSLSERTLFNLARKWIQFTDDILHMVKFSFPFIIETFLVVVEEQVGNLLLMDKTHEEWVIDQLTVILTGVHSILKKSWSLHWEAVKDGVLPSVWVDDNTNNSSVTISTNYQKIGIPKSTFGGRVSSLNPFRLLNDLVKGKQILEQSERLVDPRQEAMHRVLLRKMDLLVNWLIDCWQKASGMFAERDLEESIRLSTPLPRHFTSLRSCCVYIMDFIRWIPLLQLPVFWNDRILLSSRPRNASAVDHGIGSDQERKTTTVYTSAETLFELIHATDYATPTMILASCAELLSIASQESFKLESSNTLPESSLDTSSAAREDGQNTMTTLEQELESFILSVIPTRLEKSGLMGLGLSSLLADGATSTLFSSNEFFQMFSIEKCVVSLLSFMEWYVSSCCEPGENSADLLATWPYVSNGLRDALNVASKKSLVYFIGQRIITAFMIRISYPFVDRAMQRDFVDLLLHLVTTCCSIAAGSIQHMQSSVPVTKQSHPSEAAIQVMWRAFSILSSTISLVLSRISSSNASLIGTGLDDENTIGVPILQQVLNVSLQTIRKLGNKQSVVSLEVDCCVEACRLLSSCCEFPWTIRWMRKDILSLLESNNIFKNKNAQFLREWRPVVNKVLSTWSTNHQNTAVTMSSSNRNNDIRSKNLTYDNKKNSIPVDNNLSCWNLLTTSFHSSTTTSLSNVLMGTREAETINTCRILRRITYCFYASNDYQFLSQLPLLLERWREAVGFCCADIHWECFLGFRVLLLRYDVQHLYMFRVWLSMELMKIFHHWRDNKALVFAALRTMDYLLLFGTVEWVYTGDYFFSNDSKREELQGMKNIPVISHWLKQIPQLEQYLLPFKLSYEAQLQQGVPIVLDTHPSNDISDNILYAFAVAIEERATNARWQTIAANRQAAENLIEKEILQGESF
eukprot:jgi/Galph1/6114/GphlegSOOS_G4650.1